VINKFDYKLDEVTILQYVDHLLIARKTQTEVENETVRLLNFLGKQGLRVSKSKLQFVEKEVKYLGHIIKCGGRLLSPERIKGILELPLPQTKKEIRQFL
ncbi:POL2 protein, partial [Galbula dea]|nr:POL2 protein [Galbula dea]NXI38017.1 POL2 protein [Galbula dea]